MANISVSKNVQSAVTPLAIQDSSLFAANQLEKKGWHSKAASMYRENKAYERAGDAEMRVYNATKLIDPAIAAQHLAMALNDYALQIEAYVKEGASRSAGRMAYKMGDRFLAYKLFYEGCWPDDAGRVAREIAASADDPLIRAQFTLKADECDNLANMNRTDLLKATGRW